MPTDVRWQQRFENFERALARLREPIDAGIEGLSQLEREGLVQRFEFTFELAWKTLKDYLVYEGTMLDRETPRHVIKQAFAAGTIADGQVWIDMLETRNVMSHRYDQGDFEECVRQIASRFVPALEAARAWLGARQRV